MTKRKRPNTVYAIRDRNKALLCHVLARSPKGALTVAHEHGHDGASAGLVAGADPDSAINAARAKA